MYFHSNQPTKLYGTAKIHYFKDIKGIAKDQIKVWTITDQTGTYTYNTVQVIAQYLKPLCKNNLL